MTARASILYLLLTILTVRQLSADEHVELGLRAASGTKLTYAIETRIEKSSESSLTGERPGTMCTESRVVEVSVGKKGEETWQLGISTRSAVVTGTNAGSPVDYDSRRGDPIEMRWENPAYGPSHAVGHGYNMILDRYNSIVEIRDFEAFVESATEGMPDSELVKQALSADLLRLGGVEMFPELPRWKVSVGASWSASRRIPAATGVQIGARKSYQVKAVSLEQGLPVARIEADTTIMILGQNAGTFLEAAHVEERDSAEYAICCVSGVVMEWTRTTSYSLELKKDTGGVAYSTKYTSTSQSHGRLLEQEQE